MDRILLVLLGFSLLLFGTDIVHLFKPHPPKPPPHHHHQRHHHHHHHHHHHQEHVQEFLEVPLQDKPQGGIEGIGLGSTVHISFCASCSYKGTAVTMKKMLETSFPKIHVILENHPAPLGKRLLGNLIPVMQIGVTSIVITGEQIFPMMGITMPPQWYLSLRANRFGAIATTWLIGNSLKSTLQSSGAFEVHYNGKLVFSKLKEDRFPGEIELRDLIARRLTNSEVIDNVGNQLSSFSEDLTV